MALALPDRLESGPQWLLIGCARGGCICRNAGVGLPRTALSTRQREEERLRCLGCNLSPGLHGLGSSWAVYLSSCRSWRVLQVPCLALARFPPSSVLTAFLECIQLCCCHRPTQASAPGCPMRLRVPVSIPLFLRLRSGNLKLLCRIRC